MKKRMLRSWLCWLVWLLVAAIFHLFGNSAGTLVVFVTAAILPPLLILPVFLSRKKLQIHVEVPSGGRMGETLSGNLRVCQTGGLPIAAVHCVLRCENSATGESVEETCVFSPGRKRVGIPFTVTLGGGTLVFSVKAFAVSTFGLTAVRVPNAVRQIVTSWSEVCPLTEPDPAETQAIREYLPGDSLRSIHWKLSQKTDKLMVREYGATVQETAWPVVLPDTGARSTMPTEGGVQLHMQRSQDWRLGPALVTLLLAESLLCGLMGGLLSMVQRPDLLWTFLPGGVLVALGLLFFRADQGWRRFTLGVGGGAVLAAIVGIGSFSNGLGAFFNLLFSASEERQAYLYERLVSSGATGSLAFFLVLIGLLAACLFAAGLRGKRLLPVALPILLCVGMQVYFGVFPAAPWLLVLFFAFAVFAGTVISGGNGVPARVFLAGLLAIICAITLAVYPGENPALTTLSESIRDRFDEQIASPFSSEHQNPQEAELDASNGSKGNFEESGDGMDVAKTSEGFLGATLGTFQQLQNWAAQALLMLFAAVALYLMGWLGVRTWKMWRYRKQFGASNVSIAIRHMFRYQFALLQLMGLKSANLDFSEYVIPLQSLTDAAYGASYQNAVMLWQEAAFSEHLMTEAQRLQMRAIVTQTTQTALAHSGFRRKCRLYLFLGFGRIGEKNEKTIV